jgi:hypothetical protein
MENHQRSEKQRKVCQVLHLFVKSRFCVCVCVCYCLSYVTNMTLFAVFAIKI